MLRHAGLLQQWSAGAAVLCQGDEEVLDADVFVLERRHFFLSLADDDVQILREDQLTDGDAT